MKPVDNHRIPAVRERQKCLERLILGRKGVFYGHDILKEYIRVKGIPEADMKYNDKTSLRIDISTVKKRLEDNNRIEFVREVQGKGLIKKRMFRVI